MKIGSAGLNDRLIFGKDTHEKRSILLCQKKASGAKDQSDGNACVKTLPAAFDETSAMMLGCDGSDGGGKGGGGQHAE